MFISNDEKFYLLDKAKLLDALIKDMSRMATEITVLKAKIKVLGGDKKTVKPKKPLTQEQKAKQREYMKSYVARKKAEKQAQIAKAVA